MAILDQLVRQQLHHHRRVLLVAPVAQQRAQLDAVLEVHPVALRRAAQVLLQRHRLHAREVGEVARVARHPHAAAAAAGAVGAQRESEQQLRRALEKQLPDGPLVGAHALAVLLAQRDQEVDEAPLPLHLADEGDGAAHDRLAQARLVDPRLRQQVEHLPASVTV